MSRDMAILGRLNYVLTTGVYVGSCFPTGDRSIHLLSYFLKGKQKVAFNKNRLPPPLPSHVPIAVGECDLIPQGRGDTSNDILVRGPFCLSPILPIISCVNIPWGWLLIGLAGGGSVFIIGSSLAGPPSLSGPTSLFMMVGDNPPPKKNKKCCLPLHRKGRGEAGRG